jgi:hypothetical protein
MTNNVEISTKDGLASSEAEGVSLLFRYYEILKQDLLLQTGSFKNHVRNSQIIGGALIAIITFLANGHIYGVTQDNVLIWIVVTVTFTTVTYYLVFDVLEAIFAVRALEECLSFLEDRLNGILGTNRLVWQSGVAQDLWPSSAQNLGFIPPMRGLEVYETILVLGATVFLPGWVYYQAWNVVDNVSPVRPVLLLLEIYSVVSAFVTFNVIRGVNGILRTKVRAMIVSKWEKAVELRPKINSS